MFEKKVYAVRFYRKELKGLLDIFEAATKLYPKSTDIRWDETRNEWKMTINIVSRFDLEVDAFGWLIDKAIWLAERSYD